MLWLLATSGKVLSGEIADPIGTMGYNAGIVDDLDTMPVRNMTAFVRTPSASVSAPADAVSNLTV
ncbi:predicted protein [Plenodomus lingam JN3]|uniref:Predicted protein n=1 Tax=Leptosphaeria maculans (strain JN3 / isolate v23.1.3 / race Av1-4-5-6-7-8) TaxID=985895 RepID=E5A1F3_LEPMJ|nr:predicted protein [Plenodomus lingam JN3]CBX97417.1 predicted protein [Plenodomus lingam JN3]